VNTLPISGDGGLLSVLEALTDPRKKRGIRHKVAAILTMVAAATLAGYRSFRSVADFVADLPSDALARLGARQDRLTGRCVAPSERTIRRTVKGINARSPRNSPPTRPDPHPARRLTPATRKEMINYATTLAKALGRGLSGIV
jgi:DDE family transposase